MIHILLILPKCVLQCKNKNKSYKLTKIYILNSLLALLSVKDVLRLPISKMSHSSNYFHSLNCSCAQYTPITRDYIQPKSD